MAAVVRVVALFNAAGVAASVEINQWPRTGSDVF